MSGLSRGYRSCNCFLSAHLPHHGNIHVLAEHLAQRNVKVLRIDVNFALVNHGLLRLKDVFNRVFNRHDVVGTLRVDDVNHRGKRG